MVSITIRTPPMSTSASLHQASIYSTYSHSHSNSHPYAYASLNNSCERLIPAKKHVLPKSNLRYSGPRTTTVQGQGKGRQVRTRRMASGGNSAAVEIEQKKSYGIGGAGNIRRPSEVIYPPRTNPDGTRRRSSVWSSITTVSPGSSPDGKRATLLNLFSRRGSTAAAESGTEGYKESKSENVKDGE